MDQFNRAPEAPDPTGADHLDLMGLDAVRAGEGTAAQRAHAEACPRCRRAVAHLGRLAEGIGRAAEPKIAIPAHVDAAVRARARGACVRARRRRTARYAWPAGVAAAAAVLVAAIWWLPSHMEPRVALREAAAPDLVSTTAVAGDVDGSGRVDIVDAFILARHVEQSERLDPAWDMDGDGHVDKRDVDAVAGLAVALNGGKGS